MAGVAPVASAERLILLFLFFFPPPPPFDDRRCRSLPPLLHRLRYDIISSVLLSFPHTPNGDPARPALSPRGSSCTQAIHARHESMTSRRRTDGLKKGISSHPCSSELDWARVGISRHRPLLHRGSSSPFKRLPHALLLRRRCPV